MTFNIGIAYNTDIEVVVGGKGNDEIYGNALRNELYGREGDDDIFGQSGDDLIFAGSGSDFVDGGSGDDDIYGETGKDFLKGGTGFDYFYFRTRSEAGNGSQRDVIQDFQSGVDKVDLSDIDANIYLSGNQAFSYISSNIFTGLRGQLRYASNVLSGDVNGDKFADFQIEVVGLASANDIVL
jgi:Ca2+-binding RTX toxin-like protein